MAKKKPKARKKKAARPLEPWEQCAWEGCTKRKALGLDFCKEHQQDWEYAMDGTLGETSYEGDAC